MYPSFVGIGNSPNTAPTSYSTLVCSSPFTNVMAFEITYGSLAVPLPFTVGISIYITALNLDGSSSFRPLGDKFLTLELFNT